MLEAEMEEHLGYGSYERAVIKGQENYRNGTRPKVVKSTLGELDLSVPRDRAGSFEPQIIPNGSGSVVGKIEEVVLSLYAKGMSTRDIEEQIADLYGVSLSEGCVSRITLKIEEKVKLWQNRPLERMYVCIGLA